jgi:type IV secretion system protein VirB6
MQALHGLRYWIILVTALLHAVSAHGMECVPAYDFGQGNHFYIPANPDESIKTSGTNLIFDKPANAQVAPWVPTTFKTVGQARNEDGTNESTSTLRIYVSGAWGPWGGDMKSITNYCTVRACNTSASPDTPCLVGGLVVPFIENDAAGNLPCKVSGGLGLYGLIALEKDGVSVDPNNKTLAKHLSSQWFRTFRVHGLQQDADGEFFEISSTRRCNIDDNGQSVCVEDTDQNGQPIVARGTLYFKILDRYYQDNTGGYSINVVSGLQAKLGFIDRVVSSFKKILNDTTTKLYTALVTQSSFIQIARALLVLYVAISGVMFAMGMLNASAAELVVRLVKIALITILISEQSWNFFNTYLFSFFTDGAASIANFVTESVFLYSSHAGMGKYIMLPEGSSPLAVFDTIVRLLLSPSVHKKIWSLFLYRWYVLYIIIIYTCIGIMIFAIIRSVSIYITSLMLIAMLLFLAPIFLLMILFSTTKELFDTWLKQLLVNALALVVIAISASILINLILEQFETLLTYRTCWQTVYTLDFKLWKWSISFWYPTDDAQIDNCITAANLFSLLFICVLFEAYMEQIPTLIDSLANAGLMPISSLYGGAADAARGSTIYRYVTSSINQTRAILNPVGWVSMTEGGAETLSQAHRIYDGVSGKFSSYMGVDRSRQSSDFLSTPRDAIGGVIGAAKKSVGLKD